MTDDVHEIPSTTPNFQTELAEQLADLIPEAIADGKVDVEKLKELLDGDAADSNERFGLFWPGKKSALRAAQDPTTATLRPDFENSKDWDTTKNVFIEGDNLEVLKILQKHYHAKINMIYIDPPYNTGKDFVYPDNFKEGLDTYLEWTRQVNDEGKKLSTNAETEGRYHSNWLNMMYPRLKLARNLLADDGLIFISIDDMEVDNLKKLCNEVFGESNYVALAPRKTGAGAAATRSEAAMRKLNDYVLIYSRSSQTVLQRKLVGEKEYPLHDKWGKYRLGQFQASGSDATRKARPNMWFPIYVATDGSLSTTEPRSTAKILLPKEVNGEEGRWLWTREKFEADQERFIHYDGNILARKIYFDAADDQSIYQVEKAWFEGFTNASGSKEVADLFGQKKIFDHPKPVGLIRHLLSLHPSKDLVILDFFAGSGTTAQAVIEQNLADGGSRKWISVQLPEPVPEGSVADNAGYATISEVSRRRIALVRERAVHDANSRLNNADEPTLDLGFRSYRLDDTCFSKWRLSSDVEPDAFEQRLLEWRDSNSSDGASADDLLTELLLKQGYSLTEEIGLVEIAGLELRSVAGGLVLAYLDEQVKPSLEQLRAVVEADPQRLIVLEDVFQGDDELKTNLAQLCKGRGVDLWTA
ncbi:site-specific DNA-methyltransferase [Arthrobacter sp. zg-Y1110]|uniref:site-specific DNA-methyltransferase n=1 Tax=Arthrobacter sp. zg-Y1110 TaxID=2886932 RepID=UPI001D156BC7|nr:site-specific DNA-methyltransferase [Arthrobacter sp. zg-Y1110]MCC3291777.1 site-specific DNA-methyltransferase [Arthrobacter sp. zg-Y1110]UWX85611.1 site-specific DNA-methyltransferase [Arthrobacter sp. zg-Y1110]